MSAITARGIGRTLPAALIAIAVAALSLTSGDVPAQSGTPVRFVVPFATGGGSDRVARIMQPRLSEGSAAGDRREPGRAAASRSGRTSSPSAPPDGHTIMIVTTPTFTVNPSLYDEAALRHAEGFHAGHRWRDVSPSCSWCILPCLRRRSTEFIALAKAQPGKLNYASAGNGNAVRTWPASS